MALIGYARVSTDDQRMDLQRNALTAAGCEKVFTDTASGAKASRKDLDEALSYARKGNVLMVWRLDRLGRSLPELVKIVGELAAASGSASRASRNGLKPARPLVVWCSMCSRPWLNLSGA